MKRWQKRCVRLRRDFNQTDTICQNVDDDAVSFLGGIRQSEDAAERVTCKDHSKVRNLVMLSLFTDYICTRMWLRKQ